MYYAIIGTDSSNSLEKRQVTRAAHLERIEALLQQGRLLTAGPFPAIDSPDPGPAGFTGSLIIAEFDSLHDAENWANADPYMEAGIYQSVSVKPFRHVLP